MSRSKSIKKMIRFYPEEDEAIKAKAEELGMSENALIVAAARAISGLPTFEPNGALVELADGGKEATDG